MRSTRILIATALATTTLAAVASAAPKRVLVFGDSITWGWIPRAEGIPTTRYPTEQQWPSVLKQALGPDVEVVVDAVSGRTTDTPDPTFPTLTGAGLEGDASLPAVIAANLPLDVVVIMLGTNDTKAQFNRTPYRIALGAGKLISIVQSSGHMFGGGWYDYPAPKVIIVSPPPLGRQGIFAKVFDGGEERSRGLAAAYKGIADAAGAGFFDAGSVTATDGVDGVHLTAEGERKLGEGLVGPVKAALQ